MDTIETYIVDWSRLSREGFRRLLANTPFEIIGDSPDLAGLSEALDSGTSPTCVIVDIDRGTEEVRRFVEDARELIGDDRRLIALTNQTAPEVLYHVFAGGADALLHQEISYEAMLESLRLVMLGEKVFPSSLTAKLLQGIGAGAAHYGTVSNGASKLSQREVDILRLLVAGDSNKMIANRLSINETTVKTHLKSIQRKLNVNNRTQAAIWALNHGVVRPQGRTAGSAQMAAAADQHN